MVRSQIIPPRMVGATTIGFDLSEMAHDMYKDAIVDVVGPESVVSEPYLLKVRLLVSYHRFS